MALTSVIPDPDSVRTLHPILSPLLFFTTSLYYRRKPVNAGVSLGGGDPYKTDWDARRKFLREPLEGH